MRATTVREWFPTKGQHHAVEALAWLEFQLAGFAGVETPPPWRVCYRCQSFLLFTALYSTVQCRGPEKRAKFHAGKDTTASRDRAKMGAAVSLCRTLPDR